MNMKVVRIRVFTQHHESWFSCTYDAWKIAEEKQAVLDKLTRHIDFLIESEEKKAK